MSGREEREARLAAALRANLHRRKAQARERLARERVARAREAQAEPPADGREPPEEARPSTPEEDRNAP